MQVSESSNEGVKKLKEMIKDISICMMVTVDESGHLRSRPMDTQQAEHDSCLWFLVNGSSPKAAEIMHESRVNLSYMDKDGQSYISISGTAYIVDDRKKVKELWNPLHKAYFPEGEDDPDIRLIKVTPEMAEYWDAPSNAMVHLFHVVKSAVTGKDYDGGENKKLNL
jgi:general stress protein 26